MRAYRKLTSSEVSALQAQGCTATDWNTISVVEDFSYATIFHAHFSGEIKLGKFNKTFELKGGIPKKAGIRRASLHNCTLGDDCLVENVSNYIANYDFGDGCYVENVTCMYVHGESFFGNGTRVSVLSESGGREVPIFDNLSSHLAYLLAIYRYRPLMVERLSAMIDDYAKRVSSDRGTVGKNCVIKNCGKIHGVKIGDCARLDGASELINGSINSTAEAPVRVGVNVIAHDFIFCSGVNVDKGSVLHRSFVGQGTHISNLFVAHDSLFFSNCQCENGEACAIFAGPYTVTMHKSSLLIAGLYSFLNAGSGSNQSNHMYKLGPIHQGVVERGSKTTSDSYVLWPARVGAFSLIMGRHTSHCDTSDMPFSYLIEKGDQTHLSPGVNLKSVGTIRDTMKWPKRDKRTDLKKLDFINFNLLSPYTVSKMIKGIEILEELEGLSGATSSQYAYHSAIISRSALLRGLSLYSKAVDKFFGNSILKKLEGHKFDSIDQLREVLLDGLDPNDSARKGAWVDISGLIVAQSDVHKLMEEIESGTLSDLEQVSGRIEILHKNYYIYEWQWASEALQKWYGVNLSEITVDQVRDLAGRWIGAVLEIDNLLLQDARKEFSLISKTGFGLDGTDEEAVEDFAQVRGSVDQNDFITTIKKHINSKQSIYDSLIGRIAKL